VRRIFPAGDALGAALVAAADQTVAAEAEPAPTLAMEVATALLYLDACLEDGEFDHPELTLRIVRLAERIGLVAAGGDPQPLEGWMEELYRRVSDRQTMGSVVQELRASLSEVEKHIDAFFRQPDSRQGLVPVPQQLSSMRGVLSVLGMGQASQAVLHMRDDVDALIKDDGAGPALPAAEIDRLADNLGALSFLIDMLSVQPQLAKSLFSFDAATGKLSAVMGQSAPAREALPAAPVNMPDPAAAAGEAPLVDQVQALAQALRTSDAGPTLGDDELLQRLERLSQQAVAADEGELARTLNAARVALRNTGDPATRRALRSDLAQGLLGLAAPPAAALSVVSPVPAPRPPAPPGQTGLEEDLEMREIFIEEAREVVADAQAAMERLADAPDSVGDMTQLRRAFHTLKGSGRMVGLNAFGEAAWACEQLFNARLAAQPVRLDAPLRQFTDEALAFLARWTDAIEQGQGDSFSPDAIVAAAETLRQGGSAPDAASAESSAPALPVAAQPLRSEPEPAALPEPLALAEEAVSLPAPEPEPAQAATLLAFPELPDVPEPPTLIEVADVVEVPEVAEIVEPEPAAEAPVVTEGELQVVDETVEPEDFPSLPADAEVVAFELAFDASDETDPAEEAPASDTAATPAPVADLVSRVPDLPSAADLDLRAQPTLPTLPTLPAARETVLPFEFNLGDQDTPAAPATAAPALLMTTELPGNETPADERMPLAGTLELPAEGLPRVPGVDGLVLDLAELDVPPDADAQPLDTTPPLIASDLPLVLEGEAEPDAGSEVEAAPLALTDTAAAPEAIEPIEGLETLAVLPAPADEAEPEAPLLPPLALTPVQALPPEPEPPAPEEPVKVIGPLRIGIPLFNIFLNEADELSRRLGTELSEWSLEYEHQAMADSTIALAHSLAGNSATVGYTDLSALGRALEHALMRSQAVGRGRDGEGELFIDSADEIRRLLHQFAAGFLRPVSAALMERLADHERWPVPEGLMRADAGDSVAGALSPQMRDDIEADIEADAQPAAAAAEDVIEPVAEAVAEPIAEVPEEVVAEAEVEVEDHIDTELFPIFEEEAEELLPQLQGKLRDWVERPSDRDAPSACMRTLHTFKGGARLAGAMRLGEIAHRLEAAIERLVAQDTVQPREVEPLLALADSMSVAFAQLRAPAAAAVEPAAASLAAAVPAATEPEAEPEAEEVSAEAAEATAETAPKDGPETEVEASAEPVEPVAEAGQPEPADVDTTETLAPTPSAAPEPAPVAVAAAPATGIDWARFNRPVPSSAPTVAPVERASNTAGTGAVRVRAGLLDRLVNQAGEVSITRARIDADVRTLQSSLHELTESLDRMRRQLRDIELQAETQISSRMEAAKASSQAFDPLEMDRFTRFQELTRFMAESVNDVATLQRSLQRTLQSTEDELAAQARLTRELQDDLLRTRMVEFESMADRLYRTVRQAAKETGKLARLEIVGGGIEIDRGVLERMTGPFEHLLRNSVAHGVELQDKRRAAGKNPEGQVTIQVTQSGNEVAIEFGDDGAGLDLPRIRERALERGLITAKQDVSDEELSQLIFAPGFSTATTVTELAGRGIGMDVVRAEVNAMGGRIELHSEPGKGTRLRLLLPLTTAVTQVVMLRCGVMSVAVPSTLVEVVRRVPLVEIDAAYESGTFEFADESLGFFWLPSLLQEGAPGDSRSRSQAVVIIRSASQRVALHVDEVVGNQEVVVKNVGPQLARLPGLAGVTLLPSGVVSLIYNPVALASVYADSARRLMRQQPAGAQGAEADAGGGAPAPHRAPMVMVVDDSLTVRRVTQRLLVREGYRVVLAKDGLEALERLAEERPAVLLSDIEMPRMDGFDLLRNVRADARLAGLPVVMITSRIAQKHRDYAIELGVDHYLGKPYSEELLLSLVARYTGAEQAAPAAAAA
jgi:chemosensory pili system protein ChpA (sensor histidine kinase/response regulator)